MIAFLSIIIIFVMLVNEGYAFFILGTDYFKNADFGVDDIYVSNTSFDNDDDSYYKVYFFASPYYATGSKDTPSLSEDPLTIANSKSNPYNNTNAYCTIASTGYNDYSNAFFEDGSGYYITYKKKNVDKLSGSEGELDLFNVRDFTGYIRPNEKLKIEQTYTYVCADFKGSISSEYLSGIIAASEFKDVWGFGPEFIGWTYNKNESFNRTVYKGSSTDNNSYVRYSTEYSTKYGLYTCDSSGKKGTIAQAIGNYGVQGKIEQVTSETSLEYLDSLTADGSGKGDRVIYLYPVFAAKNYSSDKKFKDNVAFGSYDAPMIKFRVNPGEKYQQKQSEEIDYTQNRYTTCLFMESLNSQKTNANYSTGNFYIDNDAHIQLDFDDWSGTWVTILNDEKLDSLGLENGYYNIDLTFWWSGSYSTTSTENTYKNSNKYLKILSGQVTSGGKHTCYYVIGFQKVEDFYLNVYDAEGSAAVKTADLRITPEIEDTLYYVVDNVYLTEGQVLSFSNSTITSIGTLSDDALSRYNDENGQAYLTPGAVATDTQDIKLIDNKISVSKSGHYSFLVLLGYKDGIPVSATIAYKENNVKYHFIVYKYAAIYDNNGNIIDSTVFSTVDHDSIYASYEGAANSYLTKDTALIRRGATASETIEKIYQAYVLVDTATGLEIPYAVFENSAFYLNRSYVFYLKEK